MKPCWEVDSSGKIIEHYLYTDEEITKLKDSGQIIIDFPWEEGTYKPKFDFKSNKWVPGLSDEEIEAIQNQPQPKTEIELLQEENLELKLALAEIAETQEANKTEMQLALAEMAEALFGGE